MVVCVVDQNIQESKGKGVMENKLIDWIIQFLQNVCTGPIILMKPISIHNFWLLEQFQIWRINLGMHPQKSVCHLFLSQSKYFSQYCIKHK